jgi:GTP pyrophosphokinase/guanosine-3',5'-bis(diphosphate) 3'-pyrophosphohydrolase
VEVITSPSARPNPAWLNFARTGRARSKIRHYLKNLEHEESQALGQKLLAQALRAEGMELPPFEVEAHSAPGTPPSIWPALLRWGANRSAADLLTDVGTGKKIASIVAKRVAQLLREQGLRPNAVALSLGRYASEEAAGGQSLVMIDGAEGASITLASCCRPIPGDAIVGYLGRGEGLIVHTSDCTQSKRLFDRDRERWMPVAWAEEISRPFETAISVLMRNGKGALAQVAQAVSAAEADITHIDMTDESLGDSAELHLLVSVRDRLHLADLLRILKRHPTVLKVQRNKG